MIDFVCAFAHNLACLVAAAGGFTALGAGLVWVGSPRIPCNPYGINGDRCCQGCADRG